jgi:hypothetical protein
MPGLAGMEPQKRNRVRSRPEKSDGQLSLGLGSSDQGLPEQNRSQCVALLGKMLLVVIKAQQQTEGAEKP